MGSNWQLAISDWQPAIGSGVRNLQTAFPGSIPVDGCDFLAYSCAAARELHPLPCLRLEAKTRKPKDISKNKIVEREIYRAGWWEVKLGHGKAPSCARRTAGGGCPHTMKLEEQKTEAKNRLVNILLRRWAHYDGVGVRDRVGRSRRLGVAVRRHGEYEQFSGSRADGV